MTSSEEAEATTEPMTDPRLVSSVIKDKPPVALLREDIKVDDRFGSQAVADGLADVIQKVEPPFTISISGTWGVGKTTLAKQLRDRLKEHKPDDERVRCVEIDLWAEDVANLRRLVALKVAVGLQDHKEKDIDKALKAKAVEFDKELRTTQTRQERPMVTIPTSKRGWIRALLLIAGLAAFVWFLWGYTTPTNPTVEATGAKFLLTAAAAILIWVLIQSGLVLSVVTSSSSTQPAAEAIGLQLKFKDEVTKHQDRKVLVILCSIRSSAVARSWSAPVNAART
jgi:KAP family P-loop domain